MSVAVDTSELVLKKIKELPPLPLVVRKLINIMENELSSAQDVKEVLSSDQALAGKVLKLVNSSFYGMSGEVSTISRAIVILGFAAVRNLATGLGVAGIMAQGGKGGAQQDFWRHAIASAASAEVLARHTGYPDPEEAFIAGLLHDIGHLVLGTALPKEFKAVLELGPDGMVENEQRLLGMTHPKAGHLLLKHWKLPGALGNAVRFHHNQKVAASGDEPLTALIALADALACVQGQVYERSLTQEDFLQLVKVVGLDVQETGDLLRKIEARVEETRTFLKIAADGDLAGEAPAPPKPLTVVMICTHQVKAAWTQGVLGYFGHSLLPMKDFFARVGPCDTGVDLVILDHQSVSAEQLTKMKPLLECYRERLVAFGCAGKLRELPALGLTLPVLPLAFSRSDLDSFAR